jgi:hypothetical protein
MPFISKELSFIVILCESVNPNASVNKVFPAFRYLEFLKLNVILGVK